MCIWGMKFRLIDRWIDCVISADDGQVCGEMGMYVADSGIPVMQIECGVGRKKLC